MHILLLNCVFLDPAVEQVVNLNIAKYKFSTCHRNLQLHD